MRNGYVLLFAAAWISCSSAPPPPAPAAQIALRGPASTRDRSAGLALCECDFLCTATGRGFVGLSSINGQQACAKANLLCAQANCATCVQSGPAFCE
jgi:hypothetical protein